MSTVAQIKRTKKFKALLTIGMDEATALVRMGVTPPADEQYAKLIAAGFTDAEAREHLKLAGKTTAEPEPAPAAPTAKELADQLVADNGFTFTKGCVYVTPDINEAAVRVRKTGRPETVASSGIGRTKAVVIYKTESGDVAIQNLTRPTATASA